MKMAVDFFPLALPPYSAFNKQQMTDFETFGYGFTIACCLLVLALSPSIRY
ncbi:MULTISPECIES: hypothetical protein [Pseudidiomarina]|uniref:hypothetical protein n=1 Tax=Pseudidiomarina TaxID=2800384 RepID=UPI0015E840E5|nr:MULTISPECIES: hypothetical protein [Pseudidiomarina]